MITVKIKYHENINSISDNEESLKRNEIQIIHLQKKLFEVRNKKKTKRKRLIIDFEINNE
ncbi:hypothetical protein MCETHM1_02826 [Flavobacteriaceae bacterium]